MYQVYRILERKINKHTKSTFSTAELEQHYSQVNFILYLIALINIAFIIIYMHT